MARETTIDWPEELGCPLRSSYTANSGERFLTIQVADGPARYRQKTSDEIRVYEAEFIWTGAQATRWEEFYWTDLKQGTLWFNMPNLVGGGMLPMICHVVEDYSISRLNDNLDYVTVRLKLEAYRSASAAAPTIALMDPVDARIPASPSVDIYDARGVLDPRPTDGVDGLGPGVYR